MRIKRYGYFVLGFAFLFGIITVFSQSNGFSTDTSILTMELSIKEGYKANPNFTLNASYPTVPDQLGIYIMKTPNVSTESAKKLAESILRPNVVEDGSTYSLAAPESYVSVDKESGAETVILDVPGLSGPVESRKAGMPSEDKIKQNADAFAAENNLLPEGYEYSGISYLTRQEIREGGELGAVEPITASVKYGRTLQGLNIVGPGSSICVLLRLDGTPLGYIKISREIGAETARSSVRAPGQQETMADEEPTYELMTPEEAFQKLQERGLTSEIANVETATVDNMYLAYYESEPGKKQVETEPIYVFEGIATGPGGSVPYTEFMYALKERNARSPSQIEPVGAGMERGIDESQAPKGEKDPELMQR